MTHIAIIGAGITGVTTAYALSKRGYRVSVLDRERYAAMQTSFANGGQLSACNAEVWNKGSTLLQGLRWMLRRDAPLLLHPAPTWHKASWLAGFVREISHYRDNTLETVRLALQARAALFAMAEAEGIDFDLKQRGILHFYADQASFERAAKTNALLREGGLERYAVTPYEIHTIEPTLEGSFYGGFYTPSDSTGDVHKFTRGLAAACARRGVRFIHDASVEQITPAKTSATCKIVWRPTDSAGDAELLTADGVVICAGVASRRFAAALGERLNIYPVKGYSITVDLHTAEARAAAPQVSILDEAAKIVSSRLGEARFRVAGTAEFHGFNRDIRHDRICPLIDWTRMHFPQVETDRVAAWSGLRPMMPNMLPRVGPGRQPGIFYNTGHGHLGWTLSAATAEVLADSVAGRLPPEARETSWRACA